MTRKPFGVSRFRRAFVHFLGGRALQASARAVLIFILIRVLDAADYGAYMVLVGMSEMLLEIVSFGLLPVAQRFVPQLLIDLPLRKFTRFVVTLLSLQITLLLVVASLFWTFWDDFTPLLGFSQAQVEASRLAILLLILVPTFRFSVELLEGHLEQGKAQISRALMPTGRALVIISVLLLGLDVDLRRILWIDIGITGGCVLLSWYLLLGSMRSLHNPDADGELPLKEMLRFGWHMAPVGMMGATGSAGALRMVLASTLGVVESGLFAFLQSLQRLVGRYLPGTLLRGIIRPVLLARAYAPGGMATVESGTSLLVKGNLGIVAAGCIVVAIGGNDLVAWLSGGKFLESGTTLLLMFLALATISQRSIIAMVLQITGHTAVLRMTAAISPIALALVWMNAERGLNTAIVILAIGSIISNFVAIRNLINATGQFTPDWRGILYIFGAAGIAIPVGILLKMQFTATLAVILSITIYAIILRVLRPFNGDELQLVERALGPRIANIMKIGTRQDA